ncbi:hypothetical protein Vafri_14943 [Volvox africanus]|uniref:Pherophorin domain-containing protein n=1 Tax=Volvox africanus TaxID=51714 RepID=A0A8J4BED5_9CHLO|nr:hypothetical protein Vafri_14943 [Volvox africanus]
MDSCCRRACWPVVFFLLAAASYYCLLFQVSLASATALEDSAAVDDSAAASEASSLSHHTRAHLRSLKAVVPPSTRPSRSPPRPPRPPPSPRPPSPLRSPPSPRRSPSPPKPVKLSPKPPLLPPPSQPPSSPEPSSYDTIVSISLRLHFNNDPSAPKPGYVIDPLNCSGLAIMISTDLANENSRYNFTSPFKMLKCTSTELYMQNVLHGLSMSECMNLHSYSTDNRLYRWMVWAFQKYYHGMYFDMICKEYPLTNQIASISVRGGDDDLCVYSERWVELCPRFQPSAPVRRY